jgi:hypothetical protein
MISKDEKSKKVQQAELKLAQAKAQLAKAKRAERKELEKSKSHHKYIMGGIIAKYFPECYSFSEKELARILASAIKSRECESVRELVIKERNEQGNTSAEGECVLRRLLQRAKGENPL